MKTRRGRHRARSSNKPEERATRRRNVVERLPALGPLRHKLFKRYIKPLKPMAWCKDPDKWLDNMNIESVLKQYETIHPWFRQLGVHPIDFSAPSPYAAAAGSGNTTCISPIMCHVKIPELRAAGIRYAAAVFNLDNHLQSGSHWVACVINVREPGVYYFDSYGLAPPKQVETFMRSLANDEPRLLKGRRIGFNGRRFQYGGSECGMYSLYFIICMIHGMTFRKFVKHPVPDKDMIALRDVLFADQCESFNR